MRTPESFAVNFTFVRLQSIKLLLFFLFLAMPAVGLAQETNDGGDTPESINEQTIYVPYEKLREVFERDGRGVFCPTINSKSYGARLDKINRKKLT